MINPVSHDSNVQQVSHPPARLPQAPAPIQKSGTLSHDTVTLKSVGDGDGK